MSETLFRDDDLKVRRRAGGGGRCCVVTFDSFSDIGQLDRPGYGEAFLDRSGIDAIHVVGRGNDWYQYPQMAAAMAAVRDVAAGYSRVVTYGSSMGGYAAIRLAGLAGAHAVFALSPQFSINPRAVFWERRWPDSSRRFRDVWESTLAWPRPAEAYVAYDPRTPDRRHMALLRARFDHQAIVLPFTGHPVTGYLAEVGLLQQAVLSICEGTFDCAGFTRSALASRDQSSEYLVERARSDWRLGRQGRIAMLREAVLLAPGSATAACRLGQQLERAGQLDEALAMHRRAVELEPGQPYFAWACSFCLEATGLVDQALAVMEGALPGAIGQERYSRRLADLRARAAGVMPVGRRLSGLLSRLTRLAG
jgi:pimeloyl-ACP methyl ester carboxylesterase